MSDNPWCTKCAAAVELRLAEIDRLNRELAEAKSLAYAETNNGPRLWKDVWQDAVDEAEWHRSSLNPQWEEVRSDARDNALEEAAKVAARFGPDRPLAERRPTERILGRWEGEQAASTAIAAAIRALKEKP